jgi:hypothetical protein
MSGSEKFWVRGWHSVAAFAVVERLIESWVTPLVDDGY